MRRIQACLGTLCTLILMNAAMAEDLGESLHSQIVTPDLERFVGKWVGTSADGRFREVTRFSWNTEKTYLELDMQFYIDDYQSGTGKGFFLIDDTTGGLRFQMISSQGISINQTQINGDADNIELKAVAANGARGNMPDAFRTRIHWYDDTHYWTEMLMLQDGKWVAVMQNEFERIKES